jgi:ABC-type oligopeptide transport system substrate-binding subunit
MNLAGMKMKLIIAAVFLATGSFLSSCNSGYKKADLTVIDFPTYDSTKFDPLDKQAESCSIFSPIKPQA